MNVAIFVQLSSNKKIGDAAATYVSTRASCPKCPLQGRGCYAETGRMGIHVAKLNAAAEGVSRLQAARAEALAIDQGAVLGGLPLRLHVAGDAATRGAAKIVAAAAERYRARGGGQPWTYTHAWRRVPRAAWSSVSVLASIERVEDGTKALARGYAPALVVAEHASAKAYEAGGVHWVPCPEQTRGITCSECRLCFNADALRQRSTGIAFAAHGSSRKRVLTVLQS